MKLMNMTSTMTMTLKEITDLLNVRHNDAMNVVERMTQEPEFGTATKISYHLPASYRKRAETIETYQLNKRQSIAVSARLNTALLMRIVDRWQELEAAETERSTAKAMDAENRAALRMEYRPMTDALKTTREDIGKETKAHHYSNEADMINRIVTGYPAKKYKAVHEMPDSSLRDLLTPIQKQAMLSLQKANTVFLEEGLSFDERKDRLNALFNRRWNAKLIEECHLMCE